MRTATSATDCILLPTDMDSTCSWCIINSTTLDSDKTRVITFTRKTNAIHYNYKLSDTSTTCSDCITDSGMLLNSKVLFHHHVDYLFYKSLKMLGLKCMLIYSFSTTDSLLLLCVTSVRSVLESAPPIWNSIMTSDANKL